MLFMLYYLTALAVLVLHFTGHLARYNAEWLIYAFAITVIPFVLFFRNL
ncbi:MAG: hypothetical protein QM639_06320 [Rhodocyclaceae bacterium]